MTDLEKQRIKELRDENKKLKKELKKPSLSGLKDRQILHEINSRGYLTIKQELPQDKEYSLPTQTNIFKIGVVSDTHIGSRFQQLTHLNTFYKMCKEEGITDIFHSGDLLEGNGKLYRGQQFEMFLNGASNQVDYVVKHYPKIKGITTHMISGNHDFSFYKESGYDAVREICYQRDDIEYLGVFGAYITIGKTRFYLMHGTGGNA